jgi:predicted phage-related endonuclease
MTVLQLEQRSDAWAAARLGRLTGTGADAILAVRKKGTGELQKRIDLRRRLVCERLTGRSAETGQASAAMRYGTEREPDAFRAYEAATGQLVKRVGFVQHDELMAGCSPDGYVGNWTGILELKCPDMTTHLGYVLGDVIPEAYLPQLIHNLWITGAQWVDFVSFDDRFPADLKLFRRRLVREPADMNAYALAASLFLSEVDAELATVQARRAA